MRKRLYFVRRSMVDYHKCWNGFHQCVGTIAVNNWAMNLPQEFVWDGCLLQTTYNCTILCQGCWSVADFFYQMCRQITSQVKVQWSHMKQMRGYSVWFFFFSYFCWILVSIYALTLQRDENWGCFMLLVLNFVIVLHLTNNRRSEWL
jgi:hypothetical protein